MSLEERITFFDKLAARFEHSRPHPLLLRYKVPPNLYEKVRAGAALCIARSIPNGDGAQWQNLSNPDKLLQILEERYDTVQNITPNGMIVPKRDLILEYNFFARAFAELFESLAISDQIACWSNLPLLRVKRGHFDSNLLKRNYSSEHRHTEAWFPGHINRTITVFLALFGDVKNNRVVFYAPPENFREEWLVPQQSYESMSHISSQYREIDLPYEQGYLYIADTATMHQSVREGTTGPRVSLDTNVYPFLPPDDSPIERPRQEVLTALGEKKLFVFFDAMHEFSEKPGARQNKSLVSLVPDKP